MRIPCEVLKIKNKSALKVACAFYSLINPNTKKADNYYSISVKQSTLCKITNLSLPTVQKSLEYLTQIKFILNKVRTVRKDNLSLKEYFYTNIYNIAKINLTRKYFCIDKKAFSLRGNEFVLYCHFRNCADSKNFKFFQSYSDISKITGISRNYIPHLVKSLEEKEFIICSRKLTCAGDYTDNNYYCDYDIERTNQTIELRKEIERYEEACWDMNIIFGLSMYEEYSPAETSRQQLHMKKKNSPFRKNIRRENSCSLLNYSLQYNYTAKNIKSQEQICCMSLLFIKNLHLERYSFRGGG